MMPTVGELSAPAVPAWVTEKSCTGLWQRSWLTQIELLPRKTAVEYSLSLLQRILDKVTLQGSGGMQGIGLTSCVHGVFCIELSMSRRLDAEVCCNFRWARLRRKSKASDLRQAEPFPSFWGKEEKQSLYTWGGKKS